MSECERGVRSGFDSNSNELQCARSWTDFRFLLSEQSVARARKMGMGERGTRSVEGQWTGVIVWGGKGGSWSELGKRWEARRTGIWSEVDVRSQILCVSFGSGTQRDFLFAFCPGRRSTILVSLYRSLLAAGSMDNLFAAPEQAPRGWTSIVKFKCGRMTHEKLPDGSFRVTALPERGFLDLGLQDSVTRLVWSTRAGEIPNDSNNNFVLTKREQSIEKVSTGNDSDRVLLVSSTTRPERKHFFWIQEPEAEGDEQLLEKMRKALGCNETDALDAALVAMGILPESSDEPGAGAGAGDGADVADGSAGNADDTKEDTN